MSAAQILGWLLIAAPFLAIAVVIVRELGWGAFFAIFGGTAALVLVMFAGTYLASGGTA